MTRALTVICDGCGLKQQEEPFWEMTFARTVAYEDSEESTLLSMDLCVECQLVIQKATDRALSKVVPREMHGRAQDE